MDELLGSSERIVILVHIHPDGDAVGSSVAMLRYLRKFRKKQASLILPSPYPPNLAFVLGQETPLIANEEPVKAEELVKAADLLICLDHNIPSRTGFLEESIKASSARKLLIDHHLKPLQDFYDVEFSDSEISSTCELLYNLLLEMPDLSSGTNLPLDIATPLFVGLTTDTNNFYNSVYPLTFKMASDLLAAGVDRGHILDMLYNSFTYNRFLAMGHFLSQKLTLLEGGIAYAIFNKETALEFSLVEGDTEGFVNMPLGIKEVNMSIFLREDEGFFRVSVRSKGDVSASDFASRFFHGGGHFNAAGGRLFFPQDIAEPSLASAYVENSAARFMQESAPAK